MGKVSYVAALAPRLRKEGQKDPALRGKILYRGFPFTIKPSKWLESNTRAATGPPPKLSIG